MNKRLQAILDLLQQSGSLTPEEKKSLADAVKESDKEITITEFKLERTEKVKRTTAILLEETIAELEQKRKSVEAQNRELEIEAALERVRSRSMAMQRSEELSDVATILFQQIEMLGVPQWNCGFGIWEIGDKEFTWYPGGADGKIVTSCKVPLTEHPVFIQFDESRRRGDELRVYEKTGELQADHYRYMVSLPGGLGDMIQGLLDAGLQVPAFQIDHQVNFSHGALLFITYEHFPEMHEIFKRFAKVFDQTYTRFLDLQKAEAQTREAQIQLALERVRARTMAMQKSDELREVVATLYEQLSQLNFDSNACNIIIIDNETNNQQYWVSGFMQKLYPESYNVPYFEHPYIDLQLQSWKQGEKYTVIEYSGKTKKEFDKQFFSQTEFKNIPQEVQEIIKSFESARLSTAFFTYGALQIIGPSSISGENAEILQRFASVFDQTYTRFLDLQKAEAQAKEAHIEAAMERIRARAMAMHTSSELIEVANVLREQMRLLDTPELETSAVLIYHSDLEGWDSWYAFRATNDPEGRIKNGIATVSKDSCEFAREVVSMYQSRSIDYTLELRGAKREEWLDVFIKAAPEIAENAISAETVTFDTTYFHFSNFHGGSLLTVSYSPPMEEIKTLQRRAASVFSLAYQRFRDLQNAEAQARESQIEAALEKVRSRSLAMHKAEELGEVITVVFDKLKDLNFSVADGVALITFIEGSKDLNEWMANPGFPSAIRFYLPYFEHPVLSNLWNAKNQGIEFLEGRYTAEENRSFLNHIFEYSDYKHTPQEIKDFCLAAGFYNNSIVFQKNTAIFINDYTGHSLSGREIDILKRVSKVFEQTYTRFLDLQKAEAQAKEAKIEAGLERVRSRAMAMQTSEELNALIGTVFTELTKLDLVLTRCVIMTYDQKTNDARWWMANSEAPEQPANFYVKYHEHPPNLAYFSAWRERTVKWIYPLEGTIKKQWDDFIFSETELKLLPDFVIAGMKSPDRVYLNASFYNSGNLTLASLEPLSDEHFDILIRFAKVFDLTYTRFNDLKQAEAQAWEAKIEAALERVRSRTMAMQRSDELVDVASILFQQVKALGVPQWNCGFNIWEIGDKEFTYYPGSPDGIISPSPCKIPLTEHPVFISFDDSRKRGDELFVYEKEGEFQSDHYRYMLSLRPGVGDLLQNMLDAGFQLPTFQIDHVANFSYGNLIFITYKHFPEMHDVFKRFAKVFEQTYTRFLDLKKAEAQARDAQIETSLERVRSKAMAMHKSEDLTASVAIVFDELEKLDIGMSRCGIGIHNKEKRSSDVWTTSKPEGQNMVHVSGDESMDVHPLLQKAFDAWLKQEDFSYVLQGEDLAAYYRALQHTNFRLPESEAMVTNAETLQQHYYVTTFPAGALFAFRENPFTDEAKNVMKRFANVFNLTYKRFQDIQKAEAQAREAHIEAALEKVRSRSLAMHKSDEVAFVVDELFLRMKELEIGFDSVNILEFTEDAFQVWAAYQPGKFAVTKIPFSKSDIPYVRSVIDAKNSGLKLFTHQYTIEEKNQFLNYLFEETHFKNLPDERKQFLLQCPCYTVSIAFAKNTAIHLQSYSRPAFLESENSILKRFVNVFEQAYTRFLDLQQAEGQAREAQIQLALERVRARTMAMQHSNELSDAASVIFQQVKELGIEAWTCGFSIWDEDRKASTAWLSRGVMQPPFKTPLTENQTLMHFYEAAQRGESLFVEEVSGETLTELYRYLGTLLVAEGVSDEIRKPGYSPPTFQVNHVAYFSYGYLLFITYKQYPEAHDIFKRFAKVFDQTYTRFLDLQKAEALARESQIEASLERVRSKTMAMHNSQDVGDTVATVFDELLKLNIKTNRCGILIFSNSTDTEVWTAKSTTSGKVNLIIGHLNVTRHPMLTYAHNSWKNKAASFSYELIGDDLLNYYRMINNQPDYPIKINMESLPSKEIHTEFYFPEGAVFAFTSEPIAADESQIFKRLASVFGQTYRRYLDLQKAEAQAREAQIEAALERVRSRTMAMHRSEEIADIVGKIFKELTSLDVALNRVLIWIFNSDEKYFTWWSANPEAESNAESYRVNYVDHPVFSTYFDAWEKKLPLLSYTLGDDLKVSWEDHLFKNTELSRLPKAVQDGMRSEKKIFTTSAIGEYGLLMAGCFEPFSEEVNDIIQRFGRVFQQSYTRYVDVQKAEAQAREATIEASLEKVRGKAMAMHNSNDLSVTASMVFTELRKLGINPFRCGVSLQTKESRKNLLYYSIPSAEGDTLSLAGSALLSGHPVLSAIYDNWVRGEDYFPVLKGESLINYYQTLKQVGFDVPVSPSGHEQYGYYLAFSEGVFYGWSEKSYTDDELKILHRFKVIIDLTFRRYMELQKSEENAKDAIRQASLDRVRAEIASMRTTNDLDRITPLIWKELNILSIPFVRCGVFIMDEVQRQMHTFLSTPEGEAIAAFNLPYETPGNVGEILSHWLNKQMYISHWDEMAFSELGELLLQQGAIPSKEVYMSTVPPGGIHLHCLPFMQGMLYVGNTTQLQESDIHLIQSVADAFSTAYARYEDFNKLESAKAQIEKTLTDLKQTQNQLVQSEKMASLGELTAGIAHEIQNPLNFVNNFSEVSNELLEEMKEEIAKGNYDEVQSITNNIKQNLEKILHHGKRADGIVKGMLQHSRSSSGVKEPTDINALADEYLRLAYHGFRAKDKSFNASTNTDLDKSIGKINVVPQDIGRVVLNLITNAFFAVTEKQKHTAAEYQPTVFLSTKRRDDCVLISVKDNGNGIPKQIREKIFQPFFTTKPTGQGTGLGLSLSYDIVKAHGGELRMETTEGEGSEFVVSIML